jgi:hypothetical protein
MLNPWFSFGFQTARQGWEAQSAMILSLMRMFGGSAFDHGEEHLTKEKGISVSKVQTAPAPVEEHSIEGGVPQAVTEGSRVHKKAAPQNRLAERARKGFKASAKKHAERRSSPAKRSRRKGR